jgi:hypothetical protein
MAAQNPNGVQKFGAAFILINVPSGQGVGVECALDFFLDDIFPNTPGKPIFTGSRQ